MANVGFIISDKLEVIARAQGHINDWIFLVGNSSQIESAMEPDKDALVKPIRKSGRRKGYFTGAFAFGAGKRIGQRLKRDQRLNTAAADNLAGAVSRVIGRETEIRDGSVSKLGRWNQI